MTGLYSAVSTVAVIVAATVAVWHKSIDGETFVTLIATAGGLSAGAGIHAAGISRGSATPGPGSGGGT